MIAKVDSGATQYFLSDRLSTRLVMDTAGNAIGRQATLPFGEDFAESGTQEKHHFTSYERDGESLTDYAVTRQYASIVGRFMRVDPHRSGCSQTNPRGSNRYAYAQNDSTNRSDPLGLKWILIGCTHYSDGFGGSCTSCTGYDDAPDGLITIRTVCDSPIPTDGRGEDFLIVQDPIPPNPLGGQTGGAPPMTCNECCVTGLDTCKIEFFNNMSNINLGASAQQCIADCIRSGPGFGRCVDACMINAATGNLRRINRYLEYFNQCLASWGSLCAGEREDCSCFWM
jgi:RHS repeat-associated protein